MMSQRVKYKYTTVRKSSNPESRITKGKKKSSIPEENRVPVYKQTRVPS